MVHDAAPRSRPARRHRGAAARAVLGTACALLLLPMATGRAGGEAAEGELAMARQARPSVVRVRWRSARYGDLTNERNAIVVAPDGLLLMAGPPPGPGGLLTVTLSDGRQERAQLVASDARTALSLLRVPLTDLRPLPLEEEAEGAPAPASGPRMPPIGRRVVMVTGDGAVAMGSVRSWDRRGTVADPQGGEPVRSTGLFGAALASVDLDAGSPLLDPKGRLVGLMVGRRALLLPEQRRAARAAGLEARPEPVETVAVPVAVVRIVLPLLRVLGRVPRGALGVTTEPASEETRMHLRLEAGGHVVRGVEAEGPGARAGLRVHDVIVAVDGVAVRPSTSLHDALLPHRPGTRVQLRLVRGGRTVELPVTLGTH